MRRNDPWSIANSNCPSRILFASEIGEILRRRTLSSPGMAAPMRLTLLPVHIRACAELRVQRPGSACLCYGRWPALLSNTHTPPAHRTRRNCLMSQNGTRRTDSGIGQGPTSSLARNSWIR